MDEQDLEVRLAALEKMVVLLQRGQQEPLLALIEWATTEKVNELGRTRGKLLALEAFARAAIAAAPDRGALESALETQLRRAEADVLMLRLPDAAMTGANEGLAETADALRRSLAER